MGGWGEKVKRSPASDPQEKCAPTTGAAPSSMATSRPAQGPAPSQPGAEGHPALSAPRSPRTLAQRNHRETKHGPRGGWAGVAAGGPQRSPRVPTAGVAARARRGHPGASVPTFAKVLQNLPPPPRSRSIFPSRRGRGTRARKDGRSWGGRMGASGRGPWRPAAPSPRPAPASRAAIVSAPPRPPRVPRAPAPTHRRGSRRRRRRHNNINTAGPPASRALRRPSRSPGSTANGDRKARRRRRRCRGARRGRYPARPTALLSGPRRPASAAPLSNRDAGRHRARPARHRAGHRPCASRAARGRGGPRARIVGAGPAAWGRGYLGAGKTSGGRREAELRPSLRARGEGGVRGRGLPGTWRRVAPPLRRWPERSGRRPRSLRALRAPRPWPAGVRGKPARGAARTRAGRR